MSSPRVGVVRDSMLTNPRISKAPLGQTRSRGLSGPGPDFTFGISSKPRDGGVAEALSSWPVESTCGDPAGPLIPDFVSLNRDAVKSGVVTSKELSQYRALMGGTTTQNPARKQREDRTSRSAAVPDITFGVRSRVATPLSDVLSHEFARRWQEEQLSRSQTSNRKQLRNRPGGAAETRSSLLRRSRALPVVQTPFTLPRFTQVAPALDTFRDQEAREQAFRAHQLDCVSRRGAQGLGTYSLD